MITQEEIDAHSAAERWIWEVETGHKTGEFWRRFALPMFAAAVRAQLFIREPIEVKK